MSENVNSVQMTLWGASVSPYVRKVKAALAYKNLNYKQIEILPLSFLKKLKQEIPQDFASHSPLGKIPMLQVGDFYISDSSAICQYLDKKFPQNRLYPDNAEDYAKVIWFENYAATTLTDVVYKQIFAKKVVEPMVFNLQADQAQIDHTLSHELPPLLDYLNTAVDASGHCVGKNLSMADIAIATQLYTLKMAGYDSYINERKNLKQLVDQVTHNETLKAIFNP